MSDAQRQICTLDGRGFGAEDASDGDALLQLGRIGLPAALAAAQKLYGPTFNPEITLKALSYFDDGNLRVLPEEIKSRLVVAAREVDLEHLPDINEMTGRAQRDYGIEL
ncbi:MAG TPA: hypothetical protein VNO35_22995 [Steroidobacteraceae bacterium]|nr:hypothetical protein [Steroidobacteraceae bacterium]